MNENLDLVEILKGCPKGTKLWSSIYGNVELDRVCQYNQYPIRLTDKYGEEESVSSKGFHIEDYDGECILFPSKDQRDWSKFKVPVEKFDYSTLKPFDRVLVRDDYGSLWRVALFSYMVSNGMLCECRWNQGIPYNDDTKHLAGTTGNPDEKYIWWEES